MKLSRVCVLLFTLLSFSLFADAPVPMEKALEQAADVLYTELNGIDGVKTVAIYPFSFEKKINQFGEYLVDEIENNLLAKKNENIRLLNRAHMDTLLEEHEFQLSQLVDEATQVIIGKKLSAQYIITGSYYNLGDSISLNIKIINLKTSEMLFSTTAVMSLDERIAKLLTINLESPEEDPNSSGDNEKSVSEKKEFIIPDYIYIDTFDQFDRDVWKKDSINKDLTLVVENGTLQISGKFRDGRLNSINSITTKSVKHKSFAVEISFRDVKGSADTIRLTVGNDDWMGGSFLQVVANFKKEYYVFPWSLKGTWYTDDEHFVDELFGDEATQFHTLRILYDADSKMAYGYVDDILIDTIPDFSFLPRDKINISVSMAETVKNTKKDILVEFDNFKCSLDLKK
ncbi:MAG: hypothetical protein JXJ04_10795 [Spirochaetales bacterium]|nr:hypothetical protein [Spirochaetales bacterium]